jgi:hypothetical protein
MTGWWWVLPDSDSFRSYTLEDAPRSIIDLTERFRPGNALAATWMTPTLIAYEETGGSALEPSDFPALAGSVPLLISSAAWQVLSPLIGNQVECLSIACANGEYLALNVQVITALNEAGSVVKRDPSGAEIRRIESYAFIPEAVIDKHIFRLPQESLKRTFVDASFRQLVLSSGLTGLLFFEVPLKD